MHKIIEHPLIKHNLLKLRDKGTSSAEFRACLNNITTIMVYDITMNLPLSIKQIETPVSICSAHFIEEKIVLVPILRAGLGMIEPFVQLLPDPVIAHVGMFREHDTLKPKSYYSRLPQILSNCLVIILDPMLATGGSANAAIEEAKRNGATNIVQASIVASPEGLDNVKSKHPDVDVYVAALDDKLNDKGYIVPGLGDAGDRLYGTFE